MTKAIARPADPVLPEAEIVENDRVELAGIRRHLRATELREWTRGTLPEVSRVLARSGVRPGGAPITVLRPCDDGGFAVTIGYPVGDLPSGTLLERDTIPAGETARATHHGPYESLVATYDRLFEWIIGHGRAPRPLMWEQYVVGPPLTTTPDAWRTVVSCALEMIGRRSRMSPDWPAAESEW